MTAAAKAAVVFVFWAEMAMEATLSGRLAELELRLVDPKVFRIVTACIDCHRKEGGKSPQSLSELLPSIPKMSAAITEEMIERSKLDEQDKARNLDYAKALVRTFKATATSGKRGRQTGCQSIHRG